MDFVKEFIEDCLIRGLGAHTVESYKSCVKDFLKEYPEPAEVQIDDLRDYLGELRKKGYQESTLRNYFAAVSSFYEYLIFEGRLAVSPIPSFRKRYLRTRTATAGERQIISVESMRNLIDLAAGDIFARTVMLFLAKSGVRRGELISMDIQDIDMKRGEFMIKPKPKRTSKLGFLDDELISCLREYLDWRESRAKDNALWINPGGHRVSRNHVYYTVIGYAMRAGLHDPDGPISRKFSVHNFRHFFTTMLRRSGMPREFIQELRGDKRKESMDIYYHIDRSELKRSYLQHVPHIGAGRGRPGTLEEWL